MKILFNVLFILFGFSSALFSQHLSSNIEKLSREADVILTGKITAQKSEWNKDKTKIYTHVKVKVDEFFKAGGNQQEITVVHLGGEVGEVGELYSHTPKFVNDEDVLLFLKKDKSKNYKVLYGEEGKLTLYEDQITGEKITSSKEKISSLKKEIKQYTGNQ